MHTIIISYIIHLFRLVSMKKLKLAINGFGRIGRCFLRASLKDPEFMDSISIIAINDLADAKTLAHLLKYDSVFGRFDGSIVTKVQNDSYSGNKDVSMIVNENIEIKILSEKDPALLPWKEMGIDIVLESSGRFNDAKEARKQLAAGAKKVIISAPAKDPDATIVMGVNDDVYDSKNHQIVSMASCTTNCLAPVVKVLNDKFGIQNGYITTTHAITNDQNLLDLPHKDLRRARAATMSIIPTTTGAAKAVGEVMPDLKGKIDGIAMRVPTANVSVVDLVVQLNKKTSAEDVNAAFKKAASGSLMGILAVEDAPLVSIDFRGNGHSSIVDSGYTKVMDGDFAKVMSWYDNEWGYSSRCVDLALMLRNKGL